MLYAAIALVILFIIFLIGFYFSQIVLQPKTFPWEKTREMEIEFGHLDMEEFESWEKQEVTIHSPNGYDLFGYFFPMPGSKKTLIISHGITYTLFGSIKYMPMFRDQGFNILIYDLRNHGRSEKKNTTYGYYEKFDLRACVDWVKNHVGTDSIVGTMGESLGAAITLQHAAIDHRIAFAIADCPFADLDTLLAYRLKEEYHLPPFPLLPLSNWFVKIRSGVDVKNVSPIESIKGIETPLMFAHGQEDRYIPPEHSVNMANAKIKGEKLLYLAPNARHAEAFWKNQEEYRQQIYAFLKKLPFE